MSRRLVRLVLGVVLVGGVIVAVVVLATATGSTSTCSQSPTYGKQCLDLSGTGLSVAGIEAHFAQAPDFFTQTTWTFETTTYRCDPRGRSKTECPTAARTYGSLHHGGNPNLVGTVCSRAGAPIAGPVSCSGSLNFVVPHPFSQPTWLCVEIAFRVNGRWVDNGTQGAGRACAHVH